MTAGNRGRNIARKSISECRSMDEAPGLIALDIRLKGMPRQLATYVRDRSRKNVREGMEAGDSLHGNSCYDGTSEHEKVAKKKKKKGKVDIAPEQRSPYIGGEESNTEEMRLYETIH